jgi:hypothetical protein
VTLRTRRPRGQNLVLLALTMLFIVLMVTITLSLGVKVRQRHELQNLADVAAYSNAVQGARAFNNMAMINRLMVSTFVAQAADESLISYASYGRAMANAAVQAADNAAFGCDPKTNPGNLAALKNFASGARGFKSSAFTSLEATWRSQDEAAGNEAAAIQHLLGQLASEVSPELDPANPVNKGELRYRLFKNFELQTLTRSILDHAGQSDVHVINGQPATITMREFDSCSGDPGSGLCFEHSWSENMLEASMGSRGNTFSTSRTTSPAFSGLTAAASNAGVTLSFAKENGSGYWSIMTSAHAPHVASTETAWADDHGTVTVSAGGCSATESIYAYVKSTDLANTDDEHDWSFRNNADEPQSTQIDHHTMGKCFSCPSVWVRSVGFKPVDAAADAWGEPKVVVALERDVTARKFPWELHFTFPFVPNAKNKTWDARGEKLESSVGAGLDVSKQTAVATAMVYFHRFDHWREPPNLLNPFWRATLVPADVDAQGKSDLPASVGQLNQVRAWTALKQAGFEGEH